MEVKSLQQCSVGPAIRCLQEAAWEELASFRGRFPTRYTSLQAEEAFQRKIHRILLQLKSNLKFINKFIMLNYLEERQNMNRFDTWVAQMKLFTSMQGIRTFRHTRWCQATECHVYGCQFMLINDFYSIRIYPSWLEVVYGPYDTIKSVHYLEFPSRSFRRR